MPIIALIKLCIIFETCLLAALLAGKAPKSRIYSLFLCYVLLTGLYAFVELQLQLATTEQAYLMWKPWEVFIHLAVAFIFHFVLEYTRVGTPRLRGVLAGCGYVFATCLVLVDACFTLPIMVEKTASGFEREYTRIAEILNGAVTIGSSVFSIAALGITIWFVMTLHDREERVQAMFFATGFSVLVVVGVLIEFVLPYLLNISTPFSATTAIVLVNPVFAYGIVRHDFLRLSPVDATEELLHMISDGMACTDQKNVIRYVNPAFATLCCSPEHELLDRPITEILKPNTRDRRALPTGTELCAMAVTDMEALLQIRKGQFRPVSVSVSLYRSNVGRVKGRIYLVRDITERKQMEEHQRNLERMMRHDLRSPLNGIVNIPEVILHEDNLTEEQRRMLRMLSQIGLQMCDQIETYLYLTKIEDGSYEYQPKDVDVAEVIREVIFSLENLAQERKVMVSAIIDGQMMTILTECNAMCDRTLLFCLLANLLKNAIEASPQNEEVVIEVNPMGTFSISIHNQGIVPADIRDTVFEKFVTSGKDTGTGLGCYSAKKMIEAMRGRIYFESDAQNGTHFTIAW